CDPSVCLEWGYRVFRSQMYAFNLSRLAERLRYNIAANGSKC
ncbi:hypothetical protein CICLE_v100070362mg, partial [Citrus x clementina]